jgi:hypothetical protein
MTFQHPMTSLSKGKAGEAGIESKVETGNRTRMWECGDSGRMYLEHRGGEGLCANGAF